MRGVPIGPADVVPAEAEQEGFQAELRVREREAGGIAGATEIADCFVVDRRHVDARQITGAEQARQLDGVAPVGLDLVARLLGDQRGGHHLAGQPLAGQ